MTTIDATIDKVHKLLRLSTSSNPNEAALAAAKAQELIDTYHLTNAMLALNAPTSQPDEPIIDFGQKDAPLTPRASRIDRWRYYLAAKLAKHNACHIYQWKGSLQIIGRPGDADTIRYLYGYLAREVERLTDMHGRGCGRTWRNNFTIGVVDTIGTKLRDQHQTFTNDARARAGQDSTALVRVNQALATIADRATAVEVWTKTNVKLHSSGGSGAAYDHSARNRGRAAGQSIAISRARAGLSGRSNLLN